MSFPLCCVLVVCSLYSVPLWVAPLLHAASRLRRDPVRRRKAYRLIQRRLVRAEAQLRLLLMFNPLTKTNQNLQDLGSFKKKIPHDKLFK